MNSENTGVKNRQDFFESALRSLADEFDLSGAKIDGFDLFNHHEPGQVRIIHYGQVKRKMCIGVRDRANNGKTGPAIPCTDPTGGHVKSQNQTRIVTCPKTS
jgi:hypothetical protein